MTRSKKMIVAAAAIVLAAAVIWACVAYGGKDTENMGFLVRGAGRCCFHG